MLNGMKHWYLSLKSLNIILRLMKCSDFCTVQDPISQYLMWNSLYFFNKLYNIILKTLFSLKYISQNISKFPGKILKMNIFVKSVALLLYDPELFFHEDDVLMPRWWYWVTWPKIWKQATVQCFPLKLIPPNYCSSPEPDKSLYVSWCTNHLKVQLVILMQYTFCQIQWLSVRVL